MDPKLRPQQRSIPSRERERMRYDDEIDKIDIRLPTLDSGLHWTRDGARDFKRAVMARIDADPTESLADASDSVWEEWVAAYAAADARGLRQAREALGLTQVDTVIVSRHPAAVAFIRCERPELIDAPVLAEVTSDDVRGKHVIGNLPLHLAALAASVEVIEFTGGAPRAREYGIQEMDAAGAHLSAYVVRQDHDYSELCPDCAHCPPWQYDDYD